MGLTSIIALCTCRTIGVLHQLYTHTRIVLVNKQDSSQADSKVTPTEYNLQSVFMFLSPPPLLCVKRAIEICNIPLVLLYLILLLSIQVMVFEAIVTAVFSTKQLLRQICDGILSQAKHVQRVETYTIQHMFHMNITPQPRDILSRRKKQH